MVINFVKESFARDFTLACSIGLNVGFILGIIMVML